MTKCRTEIAAAWKQQREELEGRQSEPQKNLILKADKEWKEKNGNPVFFLNIVLLTAVTIWRWLLRTAPRNDCKESTGWPHREPSVLCLPDILGTQHVQYIIFTNCCAFLSKHTQDAPIASSFPKAKSCVQGQGWKLARRIALSAWAECYHGKSSSLKSTYFPINGQSLRTNRHELIHREEL